MLIYIYIYIYAIFSLLFYIYIYTYILCVWKREREREREREYIVKQGQWSASETIKCFSRHVWTNMTQEDYSVIMLSVTRVVVFVWFCFGFFFRI